MRAGNGHLPRLVSNPKLFGSKTASVSTLLALWNRVQMTIQGNAARPPSQTLQLARALARHFGATVCSRIEPGTHYTWNIQCESGYDSGMGVASPDCLSNTICTLN